MKKIFVAGAGLVVRPSREIPPRPAGFLVEVGDVEPDRAARIVGRPPARDGRLPRHPGRGRPDGRRDRRGRPRRQHGPVYVPSAPRPDGDRPRQADGHGVLRQPGHEGSRRGRQAEGRHPPERARPRSRHRPHGGDAGHPRYQGRGGQVLAFVSWCGGLPAPEANTNPFGYKFSWSPKGVLLAGKNSARFLEDGEGRHSSRPRTLFESCRTVSIPGRGDFEGYPNRDSVPYAEAYGIPGTKTMLRGTLRYPGWCVTMKKIGELGAARPDGKGSLRNDLCRTRSGNSPMRARAETQRRPSATALGLAAGFGDHRADGMAGAPREAADPGPDEHGPRRPGRADDREAPVRGRREGHDHPQA